MIVLAFFAVLAFFWLLVERGCRETPAAGVSWFEVYPHLRVSKKARGRGQINSRLLSRREQKHGRFNPKR